MDHSATTPWTRLFGSELWNAAKTRHELEAWRKYHAFPHPLRMYGRAQETFGMAYCPHLDKAVATHDVIIDGMAPELASAAWLENFEGSRDVVARNLILSTVGHHPGADNRLILLDLGGFLFDDERRAESELVREEQEARFGWDAATCSEKSSLYLSGLERRLRNGLEAPNLPASDREWLRGIASGVASAVAEMNSRPEYALS